MSIPSNRLTEEVRRHPLLILSLVCLIAFVLQFIRWDALDMWDRGVWADEARFLMTGDPHEFDFLSGYGHPGGPILEGTIAMHTLTSLPEEFAVQWTMAILNTILIVGVTVLCYKIRQDLFWVGAAFITVSMNWLYQYATPPSGLAAVLVPLVVLMTIYLCEYANGARLTGAALWGVVAGAALATRFDMGVLTSVLFFPFLVRSLGWRSSAMALLVTIAAFVALDPFMWFMPIQHLRDLVHKITYHYADFQQTRLDVGTLCNISLLAGISVLFAVWSVLKRPKDVFVPAVFVWTLLGMTALLYAIFLTAHSQAERYYLPILFVWEILLPLFMLPLIRAPQVRRRVVVPLIIGGLVCYHLVYLSFNALQHLIIYI